MGTLVSLSPFDEENGKYLKGNAKVIFSVVDEAAGTPYVQSTKCFGDVCEDNRRFPKEGYEGCLGAYMEGLEGFGRLFKVYGDVIVVPEPERLEEFKKLYSKKGNEFRDCLSGIELH